MRDLDVGEIAEALARLQVQEFPAIVVNDCCGGDLHEQGRGEDERSG